MKTYYNQNGIKAIQYTEETRSKIQNYLTDHCIFWENQGKELSIFRGCNDFINLKLEDYLILSSNKFLSRASKEDFEKVFLSVDEIKQIEV